jgi:hypothetical protein
VHDSVRISHSKGLRGLHEAGQCASGRVGIGNAFSLLRLGQRSLADVVYLEHIGSALFLEDPNDLDPYKITMNRLSVAAGEPRSTPAAVRRAQSHHRVTRRSLPERTTVSMALTLAACTRTRTSPGAGVGIEGCASWSTDGEP